MNLGGFAAASLLVLAACGSALSQSDYKVITVTNPGAITGTVKWSGPVPAVPSILINKDPNICDPQGKKTRDLERLVIGPDKGVANTVVYLRNIAAGKPMVLPESRRHLDQRTCRYEPHLMLVPQDANLSIKSEDPVLHTVHMQGAASYNLPFPYPNQVVARPLNQAGVVEIRCNAGHVWMNANILVVSHPYYAVTDETGTFTLDGIPPGTYELVAWHEGWQTRREEGFYDVLSEQRMKRPVFSQARTWQKTVEVPANGLVTVNFLLSDK